MATDTYYRQLERILNDFKNGASYSESIDRIENMILHASKHGVIRADLSDVVEKAGMDIKLTRRVPALFPGDPAKENGIVIYLEDRDTAKALRDFIEGKQ